MDILGTVISMLISGMFSGNFNVFVFLLCLVLLAAAVYGRAVRADNDAVQIEDGAERDILVHHANHDSRFPN